MLNQGLFQYQNCASTILIIFYLSLVQKLINILSCFPFLSSRFNSLINGILANWEVINSTWRIVNYLLGKLHLNSDWMMALGAYYNSQLYNVEVCGPNSCCYYLKSWWCDQIWRKIILRLNFVVCLGFEKFVTADLIYFFSLLVNFIFFFRDFFSFKDFSRKSMCSSYF